MHTGLLEKTFVVGGVHQLEPKTASWILNFERTNFILNIQTSLKNIPDFLEFPMHEPEKREKKINKLWDKKKTRFLSLDQ